MGSIGGENILGKLTKKCTKIPELRFFKEINGREWGVMWGASQSPQLGKTLI